MKETTETRYTPKQLEYIESVGGAAHMSAVEIIGALEKELNTLRQEARLRNERRTESAV